MPSEEVIELSIEETNKLRSELGLKPLRIEKPEVLLEQPAGDKNKNGEEEALELSVEETNKLREKLGLAPLRDTKSSKKKEVHKPAENTGLQEEASQRIERAKLRRQVEEGASKAFGSSTLVADENGTGEASLSWADKMRKQKAPKKKKEKKSSKQSGYGENDLEGMQVRNSVAGLEMGENAVLTLADQSILETKTNVSNKVVGLNVEEDALENIQLTENEKQLDGLRKKRMLEMGMGRAGGYAGFDDDEFEELGGTLGPSLQQRGGGGSTETTKSDRGFRLGSQAQNAEDANRTDYDKVMTGQAVSLAWKGDVVSSDYMTIEEEQAAKEAKKKSKKEAKFKKKKKSKKDKKKRRRTDYDDDEEEDQVQIKKEESASGNSLLSKLESTADADQSSSLQKRRRVGDLDDEEEQVTMSGFNSVKTETVKPRLQQTNRSSYDKAMEKGNERTNEAFKSIKMPEKQEESSVIDAEPDDSFLNAALAKARRLNRLRKMNSVPSKGADAVAEAVKSSTVENGQTKKSSSGISFSIDDTREFSRAIRARTQQKERQAKKEAEESAANATENNEEEKPAAQTDVTMADKPVKQEEPEDVEMEEEDLEELAKEVEEDDVQYGFDGSTTKSAGVGRGLSSFVSMLKTTGEIKGKHGGKEELRGRAKDERNYENYEALDLSKVVSIGANASSKDKELANREIKLEYRDSHGRLLTQKEAYRDLCYQFHGHGASKRNEEKRLKQIAREQGEARMASRQVTAARDGTRAGTLGALKATQKATGKAFIVHKT
eukprot:CAMPEP_0116138512 /NCGR_PEP_ID=MMETSP0329-20121206/12821_1 /TAXON_ID=697910 /ORGANISM="Pseudo-nitzschia arenysensis, Strain B593" /LENGTH=777 /DNA_ID=CAMNT_0003633499 /DNA_START=75 /DNA_END=2408 /DNA_ORIENTATION=-